MQVWAFWSEIGQEPMVHSRFLPPKVANSTTQVMPNRRRLLLWWMFHDVSPSKTCTGYHFQSTKQTKHHIESYVDVHTEYTWYIIQLGMIPQSATVTTTMKPYIFRRQQIFRINPLIFHWISVASWGEASFASYNFHVSQGLNSLYWGWSSNL